jgi:transketolase N-terminal domain/subunit
VPGGPGLGGRHGRRPPSPDNLIAIVDYNKFQLDGAIEDIIGLEPFAAKWESMGWQTREIDGHDMEQVVDGLSGRPVWARRRASSHIP